MSGSSIKISGEEQITFLQNLHDRKLGVSDHAYEMTKEILFIDILINGWSLYGKSGTGSKPNKNGSLDESREEG